MKTTRVLIACSASVLLSSTWACKKDAAKNQTPAVDPTSVVSWSEPVAVTANSGGGAAGSFAFSPAGKLALSWISATNGGADGKLFVQSDARNNFSGTPADSSAHNASTLKDPLSNLRIKGEVPPRLVYANDSTLYATYFVTKLVLNNKPQNALRFVSSNDGGKTWGAPSTVTPDNVFGSYDDQALMVTANGGVFVSWIAEGANDTSHVFFARSANAGKTWSKPRAVDIDASCSCCKTSFAAGTDGSLYLAWRKRFTGEVRDVVVSRSIDDGATWSKPTRVYADEWQLNYCTDAGPSLQVAKNGTVHIAWFTGKLGRAGTQYAQSIDSAKTFSKPTELRLAANSRPSHVQLALSSDADQKTVIVVWDDGTIVVPQIVMRVSRDAGKTFAPAQAVSAAGVQAMYPTEVLRGDTVRVVWQERSAAGETADSLVKDKRRDQDDPKASIEVIGALQIVARQGVLGGVKK